jgi:ubiquinone biosynthesis accessory factor UbiJ
MLPDTLAAAANHLLNQADWARNRLAEHAGKRVRVELPLFAVALDLTAQGGVEAARAEGLPDVVIELPPAAMAYWLVDREQAWRQARVSGDAELAAALSFVAANIRWEFEEDLSRIIGDAPAHRAGQTLRAAARWPGQLARAGARNAAEYLSEETRLLATSLDSEDFSLAVDELRDAAERLDKRLARLEQRLAGRPHR